VSGEDLGFKTGGVESQNFKRTLKNTHSFPQTSLASFSVFRNINIVGR